MGDIREFKLLVHVCDQDSKGQSQFYPLPFPFPLALPLRLPLDPGNV